MIKNINEEYVKNRIGLTKKQVQEALAQYGENKIRSDKKINIFKVFFSQFKDFMIILLLIAATFSLSVAFYETFGSSHKPETKDIIISFVEPFIILVVIILNSCLGTYQEIKSDQAVKALEKNNQLSAKVIRNGKIISVPSLNVVPGDLLIVEAGDSVSADGILLEAYSLQAVESALTGESLPVDKKVNLELDVTNLALGERSNYLFSGTHITNGRGIILVTQTGLNTEIGKINKLIEIQEVQLTPLQLKLNKLSRIFGITGVILLFLTTISQLIITNTVLIENGWSSPNTYSSALIVGISLAVAAIPEGLITFTTVLLAIGVSKMTKENVIIKAFPAVETLGSTSIICSDKTGTLTENKMTVVKFWDVESNQTPENSKALSYLVACCDASVTLKENGEYTEVGDPTETGILIYGLQNKNSANNFFLSHNKLDSIPFDSDRKAMSILVDSKKDKNIIIVKGAPDVILSKSNNVKPEYMQTIEQWSNNAYRVIAVAYKEVSKDKQSLSLEDESDLTFLGIIGMIDPARSGVKESIDEALEAGIKPIMITGDHLTTAVAIAKELGIYQEGDLAITGAQLAQMSDEELFNTVRKISVYARVNPSDKLRIVKSWQAHKEVVAMTGDGVNDAPALKASDVGLAMGITGTDVSKQAADVILTDDNFTTIVKGIKSGRETFDRIKSVILNLLVSSLTEIIVMLIGLFVLSFIFKDSIKGKDLIILSASQLLWINLLTHGLPAIALGMTPNDVDVMKRKPFAKTESIFSRGMGVQLIIQSSILSLASVVSYLIVGFYAQSQSITGDDFIRLTSTAMFITLGVGASLNSLNLMSKNSIFVSSIAKYKLVYLASSFSTICVLFAAFVPGVRDVFKMAEISNIANYNYIYWLVPILLGFTLVFYSEVKKLYTNVLAQKLQFQH
ncbi:cation-translocating P-type ATPase [Mycoplasmopsis edwardii]|uniref:Cation-translocating P-type ATPase n=1 Tax=Mycoplasmopsis edwardii TaxID=53558 RepID=A0ACD4PHU5_9BACT|nr:cation-translocating P-type ATPase [Mycoplasmopsis edwardii]WBP84247.1 cation-translocating P-type ATPase [Mycoplasmopsis edwardii]